MTKSNCHYYHFTQLSRNQKTGPIPVTTSSRSTCPNSCPLKNNGCYAEAGQMRFHWDKVSQGLGTHNAIDFTTLLQRVSEIPAGTLWRHNQAGDLPATSKRPTHIDLDALRQLVRANEGKRGFTYTHHALDPHNIGAIQASNHGGFTVNISANTLAEADYAYSLGLPTVVILPPDAPVKQLSPGGNPIRVCPAQYVDGVTCKSCGWCQRTHSYDAGSPQHAKPRPIIGFRAHGNGRLKVLRVFQS